MDFSKLGVVDWLCSSGVLVGFIFAFLADKKGEIRVWQRADFLFNGLYGLTGYFFPALLLGHATIGELDHLHLYLCQCVSASFVALAVITIRHTQSTDSKVSAGWLIARVIGPTFMVMSDIYGQSKMGKEGHRFSEQHMSFAGLAFGLMMVGTLAKLWQHLGADNGVGLSSSRGSSARVMNQHLLVSMMISLPGVILHYGMPELVLESFTSQKYDSIHLHLVRAVGVAGLMFILQEITALQYEDDSDKRDFFLGHIVLFLMVMPVLGLYQYKHALMSTGMFVAGLAVMIVQNANSCCAAFIRHKWKKQ